MHSLTDQDCVKLLQSVLCTLITILLECVQGYGNPVVFPNHDTRLKLMRRPVDYRVIADMNKKLELVP